MNSRAWMLFAATLVSPAWAQEPAAAHLIVDIRSPEIRKIVQQNAETQYAQVVQVNEVKTRNTSLEDAFITEVETVEAPPVLKQPVQQTSQEIVFPPAVEGLMSVIFDTVVEEALDGLLGVQEEVWLSCEGRDMLEASRVKYEKCPGRDNPPHNAPEGKLPQAR